MSQASPIPPHPGSVDDPLSSPPSSASEFQTLYEQSTDLLARYQPETDNDKTAAVLRAALDYLPAAGKTTLMREIMSFGDNWKRQRQLGQFFIDAVLKPLQVRGPPPIVAPSPSPEAVQGIEELMASMESTDRRRSTLKDICMRRDGFRCTLSGRIDRNSILHNRVSSEKRPAGDVVCAHIIPYGLRELHEDEAPRMAQKATVWWALYRYFPALDGQIGPDTVDVAQNAMILDTSIHGSFDNHEFALEPYREIPNTYRVHHFVDYRGDIPNVVTLQSREPAVPLPRADFLRARFTIASILQVSGIGARIREFLDPEFWNGVHGAVEGEGSTDLAALVKRRMLIGI